MLPLRLKRNTLVSIASFTPRVSQHQYQYDKIHIGSGPKQHWYSVWTSLYRSCNGLRCRVSCIYRDVFYRSVSVLSLVFRYSIVPQLLYYRQSNEWKKSYLLITMAIRLISMVLLRGVSAPGGKGICSWGGVYPSMHWGRQPPPLWTEFLTHACENITLAQLRCGR